MKYLPLCLLFLTIPSFAQTEILDLFQKIDSKVRDGSELQCSENENGSEAESCAIDLCGRAEVAAVATVNDKNFDLYIMPGTKEKFKELDEPVRMIHERKQEELRNFVSAFKEKLKEGKPLLDFSTFSNYDSFASTAYDRLIEMNTDSTKPRGERVSFELNLPDGISEEIKKGAQAYAQKKKDLWEKNPQQGMYNDVLTTEESQAILKERWEKFILGYQEALKKNPDFMKEQREDIEKFSQEGAFDLEDGFDLGNALNKLEYLYYFVAQSRGEDFSFSYSSPECDVECKKGIEVFVTKTDYPALLKQLEDNASKVTLEENIKNCQSNLLSSSLKESDRSEFLKNYPETKRRFIEVGMKGYSQHSRDAFSDYLDNELNFSFVNEADPVDEFMSNLIKDSTDKPKEVPKETEQLLSDLFNRQSWDEPGKYEPNVSVCEKSYGVFAAWDAFAPKQGGEPEGDVDPNKANIYVSLFSCTHAVHGKGVVSHEMGHALSYSMSQNKLSQSSKKEFARIRTCITNSYKDRHEYKYGLSEFPDDHLYTEEDMADFTSAHSILPTDPLFSCALLDTNAEGTAFKELSLAAKHPMDTHSAPLLRVLREAINKNRRIPASCKELMNKNKDKYRFEKCE